MNQDFHNKNNENKKCYAGEMTKVSDSSNVNLTERTRRVEIFFTIEGDYLSVTALEVVHRSIRCVPSPVRHAVTSALVPSA